MSVPEKPADSTASSSKRASKDDLTSLLLATLRTQERENEQGYDSSRTLSPKQAKIIVAFLQECRPARGESDGGKR
jgi:hypothetical protein